MRTASLAASLIVTLAALAGCSGAPEGADDPTEQTIDSEESALWFGPDFVFDGGTVIVHDGFTSQSVARGGVARVHCNVNAIRVSFREVNASAFPGGAHMVRLAILGNSAVTVPAPALAGGALNSGAIGKTPVALTHDTNVPVQVVLDSTLAVPEKNEANNTFAFNLYRVCI